MLFKLGDENNDGQISQKEAVDAGNLLVGGLFFRADANGDGILSKQELSQAREALLAQKPMLRVLSQRAQSDKNGSGTSAKDAGQGVLSLLDSNNDGQLQAAELRQMVQTTVQSGFATADTNRDGQLSPAEINAAIMGAARAVAQAVFQKADTDGNGQLSQAEYDKAIVEPANTVFRMLDSNGDGQISAQESQSAGRFLARQIRMLNVPEPGNSPRRLLQSGQPATNLAPLPSINPANRPR